MAQVYEVQGFIPILTENLTDGNCFYSAVYRALANQGILQIVHDCQGLPTYDERSFIQGARTLVAENILAGGARDIHNSLKELYENDLDSLGIAIRGFPGYMQTFLNKKIKAAAAAVGN